MADCKVWKADVELKLSLTLGEQEARALEALAGYDVAAFLKVFYAQMGESYLKPHEAGLRSLFATARGEVSGWLARADKAREAFKGVAA